MMASAQQSLTANWKMFWPVCVCVSEGEREETESNKFAPIFREMWVRDAYFGGALTNIISQVLCDALQPSSCKSSMSLLEQRPNDLHWNVWWHLSIKRQPVSNFNPLLQSATFKNVHKQEWTSSSLKLSSLTVLIYLNSPWPFGYSFK